MPFSELSFSNHARGSGTMPKGFPNNNLGFICKSTALTSPNTTAVIDLWDARPRYVNYYELDRRMDMVAMALTALGLQRGDRVLLSSNNRVEFIEVFFGVMRAGLIPVPINTKLGEETIRHIATDSAISAAIVDLEANQHVEGILGAEIIRILMSEVARPGWILYEDLLANPVALPPDINAEKTDDDVAFILYTSGSTGKPKGVPLTHSGQLWWLRAFLKYWPTAPSQRSLIAVPLYHKNALSGAVKPRLASGGSMVLMPQFQPREFLTNIDKFRCTAIHGVPTVYHFILQETDLLQSLDLTSLEVASVGSAPVHEELLIKIEKLLGCRLIHSYGLTEGGPVMLGAPIDGRSVPRGSVGVPWPEGEVKLVDLNGRETDELGELWVNNPGVMKGYLNLPELNAERIINGWLRTGDMFFKNPDGFFYFRGRVDDMINCGGENIYPAEVENILLTCPGVLEVCVVPLDHQTKGQAPVALIVPEKNSGLTEDKVKSYYLTHGPAFAHPRRVVFCDALPLTGVKKVDRSAVRKSLQEQFGVIE
jgi:long-chain acyl-CoA synthetase